MARISRSLSGMVSSRVGSLSSRGRKLSRSGRRSRRPASAGADPQNGDLLRGVQVRDLHPAAVGRGDVGTSITASPTTRLQQARRQPASYSSLVIWRFWGSPDSPLRDAPGTCRRRRCPSRGRRWPHWPSGPHPADFHRVGVDGDRLGALNTKVMVNIVAVPLCDMKSEIAAVFRSSVYRAAGFLSKRGGLSRKITSRRQRKRPGPLNALRQGAGSNPC